MVDVLACNFSWVEYGRLGPATHAIALPKLKPRAVRKHFIVPSVRSQQVARLKRSGIGYRENSFQPFDFGNSPFSVHLFYHLLPS